MVRSNVRLPATSREWESLAAKNAPKMRRSSIFLGRIVVVFMRVNAKCAHQARPPLTGNKRLPEIGKPRATCATDPDNAVRFVSRADAEMASRAFRAQIALARRFGMLKLSGRHDA